MLRTTFCLTPSPFLPLFLKSLVFHNHPADPVYSLNLAATPNNLHPFQPRLKLQPLSRFEHRFPLSLPSTDSHLDPRRRIRSDHARVVGDDDPWIGTRVEPRSNARSTTGARVCGWTRGGGDDGDGRGCVWVWIGRWGGEWVVCFHEWAR